MTSAKTLDVVDELAGGALIAVRGNMDSAEIGLPGVATLSVEGISIVVTHGTGGPQGFAQRVAGRVDRAVDRPGDAVGIAGHTHELLETEVRGIRILNPGSITGAWPAERPTMMTLEIDGDDVATTVHEIAG